MGHISKERILILVKNEILPDLDFIDLGICVDCIKGKHTIRKTTTRSTQLLELIHTNIYGPFDAPSFGGEKYFIIFIYDFSRYGYIYLLHEKSQSINAMRCLLMKLKDN